MSITIVIADDHEIFREGFKLLLRGQDRVELVGEAENGKELMDLVKKREPEVVITDIKMPVMDGIDACKQLKQEHPAIRVIALSMFNDDNLIIDMLEAGASGYLLKNTNKDELIMAVDTVWKGGNYFSAATSHKLAKLIGKSRALGGQDPRSPRFSDREKEIIQLICEQLTSKEIAARLSLSVRTVESHRENIQEKMDARNVIGIVIYAIRNGLYKV